MDLSTLGAIIGALLGFAIAAWCALIAYDIGNNYRRFEQITIRRERSGATRSARREARRPVRATMSPARDLR